VVKEQFAKLGIEPAPMRPTTLPSSCAARWSFYKKIVRAANVPQQ